MKRSCSPIARRVWHVAIGGLFAAAASLRAQTLTEFPLPSPASSPADITAGPDGNLWFTIPGSNSIGRIGTDGLLVEFRLPSTGRSATSGPDGNLWFLENDPPRIARITPSGGITEYRLSDPDSWLMCLTSRSDGLWFGNNSLTAGQKIGRITVTGAVTEFPICPANSCGPVVDIVAGPDGNVWFTLYVARQIGRMSPSGEVTVFPVPSGARPFSITSGPDGSVWFTANVQSETSSVAHVGRITVDGSISEFVLSTPNLAASDITTGSDGRLWFTAQITHAPFGPSRIGRISTDGQYWDLALGYEPERIVLPQGITSGPDGNIWFTAAFPGSVGRISLGSEARIPRMPVVRGPGRDRH